MGLTGMLVVYSGGKFELIYPYRWGDEKDKGTNNLTLRYAQAQLIPRNLIFNPHFVFCIYDI